MSAPTAPSATGRRRRELHLAAFFPFGPHYDWTSVADPTTYYDAETYAALARAAERGLFSAMFLGDSQRLREHLGRVNDTVVTGRPDQLVLFAHLAARTQHLGFVATLNTTFAAPADLAARVATVDRLSGGRAGWNVVTTNDAWTGANFRRGGYLPRSERYRSAEEHLALVHALWDADRGVTVRRTGTHHDVVATATLPPSAQGAPVIFQAGESDEGRDFAARHAEGIFSRYLEPEAAAAFAADLRRRLVAHGRPADDLRIFPAASITLGGTAAEAREKAEWFHRRTWTDRMVVAVVEAVWGRDLSWLDPDGPLPDVDPVSAEQTRTHGVVNSRDNPVETAAAWRRLSAEQGLTVRGLVDSLHAAAAFVGTPSSVADRLAAAVRAGELDGINLTPQSVPDGFDDVVDRLVPELQERGVYRTCYPGTTLRENLGLRAPVHLRLAAAG
ncbi:nitrilotriacetate monooxygenase [Cellulosimicrobium cellulans]|uniref:Nitrilotriacetate monooxygenase n=1 Tax=Cellulosimicrobium cellulans TaxID=1710 RepID=A0A1Y0HU97_CELCE|nr:LLM class flavin-dependent oxidoreductase [Cellulosimicrobium cellulans]ARU51748.1 nitrilotriacetate monooxygenase [Cellulosimicrobium cellulans]